MKLLAIFLPVVALSHSVSFAHSLNLDVLAEVDAKTENRNGETLSPSFFLDSITDGTPTHLLIDANCNVLGNNSWANSQLILKDKQQNTILTFLGCTVSGVSNSESNVVRMNHLIEIPQNTHSIIARSSLDRPHNNDGIAFMYVDVVGKASPVTDNDNTYYPTSAAEHFSGSTGIDTLDYSHSSENVTVNLRQGFGENNFAQGDTYGDIENVIGTNDSMDILTGNDKNNYLRGLGGWDRFYSSAGSDTMDGGPMNDEVYYLHSPTGVTVDLSFNGAQIGGDAEGDILIDIEHLYGSDYADSLTGTNGFNKIQGRSGDDILIGKRDNDKLYGQLGNDTLQGDEGDDELHGNQGADTFVFKSFTSIGYVDRIMDFSLTDDDKIDLSDLLRNYDSSLHSVTDYIRIVDEGSDSALMVSLSGDPALFMKIATLHNVNGLTDEVSLVSSGNLIAE